MNEKVKLLDIAAALGVSIGTVHRALHNNPEVSSSTKARVREMAKTLGYRPDLWARDLPKRNLRVSVNTPRGTTSFWDEVRAGIGEETRDLITENVEIEYRTYPRLGEGEEEAAFHAAVKTGVDGIIIFPSRPQRFCAWMRKASPSKIPVVCVATDAPNTGRLAVVSVDTFASGALAADLMGGFLGGKGKVAVTLSSLAITEHAEKQRAFASTLQSLHPEMQLQATVEDHNQESEAYERSRELFIQYPDLAGVYVATGASIPVLHAARDLQMLDRVNFITTDLFPAVVPEIRSKAVTATIYQRPRTQGRIALRILHEFLVDGECPTFRVSLAPHLIMRGNLDFFLQRQSEEATSTAVSGGPVPRRNRPHISAGQDFLG